MGLLDAVRAVRDRVQGQSKAPEPDQPQFFAAYGRPRGVEAERQAPGAATGRVHENKRRMDPVPETTVWTDAHLGAPLGLNTEEPPGPAGFRPSVSAEELMAGAIHPQMGPMHVEVPWPPVGQVDPDNVPPTPGWRPGKRPAVYKGRQP